MSDYDRIGAGYARRRRADPRIAWRVEAALGAAASVINVGAGAGSYEPRGRQIIAVEPSIEMIRQRQTPAHVVQARAEALPFADGSVDAAMAVLTVHHWQDKAKGLRELRRVARGPVVILTFDPAHRPWLADYFPALATLDEAQMPAIADYQTWLGPVRIETVPVPHDCHDGFLYAYWRQPQAYLDPEVRARSSSFWSIGTLEAGLARLADDLASGAWDARYGDLRTIDAYDAGYRLIVAD